MSRMRRIGALLLAALVAACGRGESLGGADGGATPIARDSAGIRIVQNRPAQPGGWRTGTSPLFTLGWRSDEPTFTWVQSGRILADGGALAGDFGTGSIYRIGPEGSVLATWGRKGEPR